MSSQALCLSLSFPAADPESASRKVAAAMEPDLVLAMPVRRKADPVLVTLPLRAAVVVRPSANAVEVTASHEALDIVALEWCRGLSTAPRKSLARSHAVGARLLQRLPDRPTGNVSIDKARRLVLDQTIRQLLPRLDQEVGRRAREALAAAPPPDLL